MKPKKVEIRNLGKIEMIEVEPTTTTVKILGKMESGKSTFINGVMAVLAGENDYGDALTHGKKSGSCEVTLGDDTGRELLGKMTWTPGGRSLKLFETVDGVTEDQKGPRARLDAMAGPLLDARKVVRISSPEQERWLLQILSDAAGLDLDDFDKSIEAAFATRTVTNRDLEELNRKIEDRRRILAEDGADKWSAEDEPADFDDLTAALTALTDKAAEAGAAIRARESKAQQIAELIKSADNLQVMLTEAKTKARRAEAEYDDMVVVEPPAEGAIDAAREAIGEAQNQNIAIRGHREQAQDKAQARELELSSQALTESITNLREERREAMNAAVMPIEDLAITDDGVTYCGETFRNLSTGQRYKVGVAIAVATHGELRAVFCDGAEALDADAEHELQELCEREDVLAFLCETQQTGDGGLEIKGAKVVK